MHVLLIAAIPAAYVAGAFTPAVLRTVKAWFTKEATAVKTDLSKTATSVAADIKKV